MLKRATRRKIKYLFRSRDIGLHFTNKIDNLIIKIKGERKGEKVSKREKTKRE